VTTASDPTPWLRAVRGSHDRLAAIVAGLDSDALRGQSYDTEWTIADVLSHLGSGAEISLLSVEAGVSGGEPPAPEAFQAIWDVWNARSPEDQAAQFLIADEALVSRIESLSADERDRFRVQMFGPQPFDLAAVLGLRLSEHALHTWDVAVALDPAAQVAPDAVALLTETLPMMVGWFGRKADDPRAVAVTVTGPDRAFTLDTGGVSLVPGPADPNAPASLAAPAEAFLRLVYGRLDDAAEVSAAGVSVADLQLVFPGF
jgi:uncharacterized protein (TIGR03083 family)